MSQQNRLVEVLHYDPNWPRLFEEEVILLRPIFQSLSEISTVSAKESDRRVSSGNSKRLASQVVWWHIGSTSVPGLAAKPILDILPEVMDIELVNELNPEMESIGYEAMGEYGLPGRRYFRKLDGSRHLVHLHCYQTGNPEITRHLAFRDYLRTYPDVAQQYAAIKLALAKKYPHSSVKYQTGKDVYVEEVEKLALQWQKTTQVDR